jgi:UDP-N-acetylmuramyl tripeptide synthase
VYNIPGVAAAAAALGVPHRTIEAGIARLDGVPGRLQPVGHDRRRARRGRLCP